MSKFQTDSISHYLFFNIHSWLLEIGIYLVIGAWDLVICIIHISLLPNRLIFFNLDRSDFLPHEDEITDSKTENGNSYDRN